MLWIKNVQLVSPAQGISGKRDILVEDGQVKDIRQRFSKEEIMQLQGMEADSGRVKELQEIDGSGKYLFPGLLDVHVHLREPGQEDKEDIQSGTRAAVRGGFTGIISMANTEPVIDQRALVEFVRLQAERSNKAQVYPAAAVTKGFRGQELAEMADLAEGGAVAFSDDGKGIQKGEIMRLALEYAKLTGCPLISHCEDSSLVANGVMRKGEASARLGLPGIPASAENVMVARDALLAGETGGKLHIAHVSTKESVLIIRTAKKYGIDITAEVNPHHLLLTDQDVQLNNSLYKVNPPLPSAQDREALLEGLADGTIDMLATDHAPHTWEEKARPFPEAPFGINALETALAATWQELVKTGKISPEKLVEIWSWNPAKRFNIRGGTLEIGSKADMILFDPEYTEKISTQTMESKAQNTPFLNQALQGFPIMTWVGGRLVMKDRKVLG